MFIIILIHNLILLWTPLFINVFAALVIKAKYYLASYLQYID